jgi:YVTN family beta-propeller protein
MIMKARKTAIAVALSIVCTGALAAPAAVATLEIGNNAGGIALDPLTGSAFVTNYDDGTLSKIDVKSLAVTATFDAGAKPRRVVDNAALQRLYFVNDTSPGEVTVFDTQSNSVIAKIAVGDRPRNIAADFQKGEVYVSNRDSHSLSIIDVATNSVVATVETGRNPVGAAVDAKRQRIYVPSPVDNTVTVIDQAARAAVQSIGVGRSPGSAAVDERSGKVYVNNIDDNTISVLDAAGAVKATLPAGAGSTFGTVSNVYRRYYLPNAGDGTVTIVDTDYDVLSSVVAVEGAPQQAVVDAEADKVYVANFASSSVSVIDASKEVDLGPVFLGANPWRVAPAMNKLFVMNANASAADSVTVAEELFDPDATSIVTEYYSAANGRYFHTSDAIENRLLADGVFGDEWTRTMEFWRVWKNPGPGRVAMCRLLNTELAPVTHVYALYPTECLTLQLTGPWQNEGMGYYVKLPDPSKRRCVNDTVPLYRLLNTSAWAPDFRYTADPSVRDALQQNGWHVINGDDGPFACVPPLRGQPLYPGSSPMPKKSTPEPPVIACDGECG